MILLKVIRKLIYFFRLCSSSTRLLFNRCSCFRYSFISFSCATIRLSHWSLTILFESISSRARSLLRLHVYILTDTFLVISVLHCLVVLHRNLNFRRDHSQALISKHCDSIKMIIDISRSLNIKANQYVNIWIFSISFWFFLQSHSFSIASWETKNEVINFDLFVNSRKDLTQKLYICVEYYRKRFNKKTNKILDERFRIIIKLLKYRDILCESIEQKFKSIVVDCHKFHEILLESIEKSVENIQSIKFDYERYENESQRSDFVWQSSVNFTTWEFLLTIMKRSWWLSSSSISSRNYSIWNS